MACGRAPARAAAAASSSSTARVLAELPLPIAGLLSDAPLEEVVAASRAVCDAAAQLGCALERRSCTCRSSPCP